MPSSNLVPKSSRSVKHIVWLVVLVAGFDGIHHVLRSWLPLDERVLVRLDAESDKSVCGTAYR